MKTTILLILFIAYCSNIFGQGLTLFNDNYLHEIHFNNVDTMTFINTENYQNVDMMVDGVTTTAVGLKQKGNISASHGNNKMPFKIKTNEYVNGQEYDGIREFTLNNSFQDPSMMREKMTYDLSGEMGLYHLRTAYAKVFIDNKYWGVYTIVEGKDEMFDHIFGNRNGDAIESTDFGNLCYEGANKLNYYNSTLGDYIYIVDNGSSNTAWSRFITMLEKANNTATNYVSTVESYLNIVDFTKYQAMNVYLLNFDSYIGYIGNQVYFYDGNTNIWQIIPWDFNASFGLWNTLNYGPISYPIMPVDIYNGCIASNINTNPTLENLYYSTMCDLTTTYMDTTVFNTRIDNWKSQIAAAVYADWRKDFTNSAFDNATDYGYYWHTGEQVPAMKTFVKARYETISAALQNINFNCTTSTNSLLTDKSNFEISPNPATDKIYIRFDKTVWNEVVNYEIMNTNGQIVQKGKVDNSTIFILNLNSGLFILKCFDRNGNIATRRVLVTY
jgi:hypothetical protein